MEAAYASLAGPDEVALLLGPATKRRIAFASIRNGVLRREIPVPGGQARAVVYSASLKTIYYVAQGTIYALPEAGGSPVRLTEGEDLTIDPSGRMLVVHSGKGMARVQLPSGTGEPIELPTDMRLATVPLSPTAIDRAGRVLLSVVTPQDFDYKPAIANGRAVTTISTDLPGDHLVPGWTSSGDIIAVHDVLRSELWRFNPMTK